LIKDLAKLKGLTEDVRDREFDKLKKVELEEDMVDSTYFPIAKLLPPVVEKALT
jgi:NuA3 HAT complex component NTO1